MSDEENNGPNTTLKAFGFRSKKEAVGGAIYYSVSHILTILLPNLAAAAIGSRTVDDWCKDHRDTCDQYDDPNESLEENIKELAYGEVTLFSIFALMPLWACLLSAVVIPKHIIQEKCQGSEDDLIPLIPQDSTSNSVCSLFKKFKDNVLPTKSDVYQLFMTAVSFMVSCSVVAWLVAEGVKENICDPDSVNPCDYYFPNATSEQLHEAVDLSNDAYNSILSSGILLGAVASILIPVATMSFAVYFKYRMSQNVENARVQNQKDVDDFHSLNNE